MRSDLHDALARRRRGGLRAAAFSALAVAFAVTSAACAPKIKGGPPVNARPALRVVTTPSASYRVWVVVRRVQVTAYPYPRLSRQPLVQFTGDAARLKRGWGRMALLASPTRVKAGETVDVFADKVLWSQTLARSDKRTFVFWLRQNQKSAPTPGQRKLRKVIDVARVVEGVSDALGQKIPAAQALTVTVSVLKALSRDPLILRWRCPWSHVLSKARAELSRSNKNAVELDTELVARERKKGKPVARATLRFIVARLDSPAAAGTKRGSQ